MYHPGTVMGSDQQEVWGRWASSTDRPDRDDRSDEAVTDYSNLPRDSTRVPLAHRIQLKFDRFSGFINEYFSNISPGGIFIRTDTPEPPGQLLDFEFRLGDGYELIRGRGEVVWARQRGEGLERPPGMGVRFIELSPGSKDLIYKIVDDYAAHGGKPFDLTPPAALENEPPVDFLLGDVPPVDPGAAAGPAAADPAEPPRAPAARGAGSPPPGSPVAAAAVGSPAASPPSAPAPAAGLVSLPWTLELPAIQQLPGVPAITPRSPLEALGAGAGAATSLSAAAEQQPGALDGVGDGTPPEPSVWRVGAAASHAADPLAQVAAALPPLDELAPEVPALPPAPASVPAPAPVAAPAPAPAAAPAFSSFDLAAPRRRSRMPLLGALTAIALLGLAVYLLRDPAMDWIERYQAARSGQTPAAAPATPPLPAPPDIRARRRAGSTTPAATAIAAAPAASAPIASAPIASTRATSPSMASTPAAASRAAPAAVPASPSTASRPVAAPATSAPAASAASAAIAAAPGAGAGAPGPAAGSPGPVAAAPAGRAVMEPVATAGAGRPATAVERITWQASGDGTEVVLWGNGEFTRQSYSHNRIGGSPVREVFRIAGIERPYASSRIPARTPELLQIRTGQHPGNELDVVLDLGGRGVQVTAVEPGPRQLHIHLRGK
jgi:molecular chaperone DnaK